MNSGVLSGRLRKALIHEPARPLSMCPRCRGWRRWLACEVVTKGQRGVSCGRPGHSGRQAHGVHGVGRLQAHRGVGRFGTSARPPATNDHYVQSEGVVREKPWFRCMRFVLVDKRGKQSGEQDRRSVTNLLLERGEVDANCTASFRLRESVAQREARLPKGTPGAHGQAGLDRAQIHRNGRCALPLRSWERAWRTALWRVKWI